MGKKKGWSEGVGLGKSLNGRKVPVKVSMKMDKIGLGNKSALNSVNPWWAKAFDKTAKRVRRRNNESDVSSQSSDSEIDEYDDLGQKINSSINNKRRIKNAKSQLYKSFVSAGVLKGDRIITDMVLYEKLIKKKLKILRRRKREKCNVVMAFGVEKKKARVQKGMVFSSLSDDQMFKLCGGRTAHK